MWNVIADRYPIFDWDEDHFKLFNARKNAIFQHLNFYVAASDDYEWQPPTEAEMKIIQARRERSDKISKLMGDYLLKGYKMLGSTCPTCMVRELNVYQ